MRRSERSVDSSAGMADADMDLERARRFTEGWSETIVDLARQVDLFGLVCMSSRLRDRVIIIDGDRLKAVTVGIGMRMQRQLSFLGMETRRAENHDSPDKSTVQESKKKP